MELYQLRTFLTVAEEGQLTRAAEKLFTSQPAVSAQIRALESELGVKLFERTAKGMLLTSAGTALREQARRIVDAARDFKHCADHLRGSVSGELVFGLNNRPEVLRLMEILRVLTDKHSELRYEMVSGSSGVILQGIEEGTISIGFFEGQHESNRLTVHQLDTIELCLACPKIWEQELSKPDWKMLEHKPWIFVSPMCSYFRAIQNISSKLGLNLNPRFKVNEDLTVLNLVAEGLGITMVAREQIEMHQFQERVVALPHFRAEVPLSVAYLTERAEEPAIKAVRDAVLEVWKDSGRERRSAKLETKWQVENSDKPPVRKRSRGADSLTNPTRK